MFARIVISASLCSGLMAPVVTHAATLVYEYRGQCSFNCEDEGLAVGAPASGRVVIDDGGFTPDGFFTSEALVDFSFDLGGIRLDRASAGAWSFGGVWGRSSSPEAYFQLGASTSVDRFNLGPTISAGGGPLDAFSLGSFMGTCETEAGTGCSLAFRTAAQFEMTAAPIPIPVPLVLLLSAVSSLAMICTRGKRVTSST